MGGRNGRSLSPFWRNDHSDEQFYPEFQFDLCRRGLRRFGQGHGGLELRRRRPQRRTGIKNGYGVDPHVDLSARSLGRRLGLACFSCPGAVLTTSEGALYSLAQTLIQLVIIFPKMGKGMWGLELGYMTPVLVTFFGVIWGLATAFWLKFSREG